MEYVARFKPDSIIDGQSKSILRKSFKGKVPDAILQQKGKAGFPSPIDTLLKVKETTAPVFEQTIKDVPFLDYHRTMNMCEDFYKGKAELGIFWRTYSLALWYRKFFTAA